MDLTLTPNAENAEAYVLCGDGSRSSDGSPCGPSNISVAEAPGVEMREYIGADRVVPERARCDHGTITFGATRTYPTPALATAYALVGHLSEPVTGALKYGQTVIFSTATVTSRRIAVVGCTVSVVYTIEG